MLSAPREVYDLDERDTEATQSTPLGTKGYTKDGRVYRYGLAGGVTLAVGKMTEMAAIVANHANRTLSTAAVGATEIEITVGATAVTANQYAGGYLGINAGTGLGIAYLIRGNDAIDSSGTGTIFLDQEQPIKVATATADSKGTLKVHPFSGVVVTPSAATAGGTPTGVPNVSITNAYYGWLQTGGMCPLLSDSTVYTLGEEVSQGVSEDAGSGSLKVATLPTYGIAAQLGVSGEYQFVDLKIDT